jgi:short-subunit dehydrogenase
MKTVVITGASAGIGYELALFLAKKYKAQVQLALCARSVEKLASLKEEIETAYGSSVLIDACDVSLSQDCKSFIQKIITAFSSIDVLVLNAGVSMWSHFSELEDPDQLKPLIDVNYFGAANPLFYALPYLRKTRGRVLGISSLQGYIGMPKHCGYSAAKHALHGLFDSISSEEPEVHFQKIILGWVRNTNIRNARAIESEEGQAKRTKHIEDLSAGCTAKKNSKFAVSAKECATQIVDAMNSNKSQTFVPPLLKWVWLLNMPFPKWVRKNIKKAVEKE